MSATEAGSPTPMADTEGRFCLVAGVEMRRGAVQELAYAMGWAGATLRPKRGSLDKGADTAAGGTGSLRHRSRLCRRPLVNQLVSEYAQQKSRLPHLPGREERGRRPECGRGSGGRPALPGPLSMLPRPGRPPGSFAVARP